MKTPGRWITAGLIAMAGVLSGCGQTETSLVWNEYSNSGPWRILRYTEAGSPEKVLACSAVTENIQRSSLRIARTKDGINVSMNGMSPSDDAAPPQMFIYTDDNDGKRLLFDGQFTDEPAYEYDHWLGKTRSTDDPLLAQIKQAETLSVSIHSPGNRTGNDWPESHFELYDSQTLFAALEHCFAGADAASAMDVPSTCSPEKQLPNTGMCISEARHILHKPMGGTEELAPACRWTVTDAKLTDGEFLLFKSMRCGENVSALSTDASDYPFEFKATVAPTGDFTDGFGFDTPTSWDEPVVTVFKYDDTLSHLDEIPRIAKEVSEAANIPYSDACKLEYDEHSGLLTINDYNEPDFESDSWVSPCGPLGAQEGRTVLWSYLRSGYVAAMHYPFDGYFGIDWQSIALVKKDENGNWAAQ